MFGSLMGEKKKKRTEKNSEIISNLYLLKILHSLMLWGFLPAHYCSLWRFYTLYCMKYASSVNKTYHGKFDIDHDTAVQNAYTQNDLWEAMTVFFKDDTDVILCVSKNDDHNPVILLWQHRWIVRWFSNFFTCVHQSRTSFVLIRLLH